MIAVDTYWWRQADENVNEPQLILIFRILAKPKEDYDLVVYRVNEAGQLEGATVEQAPALVWWPSDQWLPGDLIRVRITPFWWTGDKSAFGYALGFVRGHNRWNASTRLHITAHADDVPISVQENLVLVVGFRRLLGIPYPDSGIREKLVKADSSIFSFQGTQATNPQSAIMAHKTR